MKLYKNKWQLVRIGVFVLIVLGCYAYNYAYSHGWPSRQPSSIWFTSWGNDEEQVISRKTYLSITDETNSYILGNFPGVEEESNNKEESAFGNRNEHNLTLVKIDNIGCIEWTIPIEGTYAIGCTTNQDDMIFIGIYFAETDSSSVSAYNSDGDHLWTEIWESPMYVSAIDCDQSGNLFALGDHAGRYADFDPTDGVAHDESLHGNYNGWLVASSPAGEFLWYKAWGPVDDDLESNVTTSDIIISDKNIIHLTGSYGGSVDLDPGEGIASPRLSTRNYWASYDINGNLQAWKDGVGGYRIALAPDGIVFMNPNYLIKTDYLGTTLWFHGLDGHIKANDIDIDPDGVIYLTGYFSGKPDMDFGSSVHRIRSVGNNDAFFAMYSGDSSLISVETWGKSNTSDSGDGVVWTNNSGVLVTGYRGQEFYLCEL